MALDVKGALDSFLDDFKTGNVQGMLTKYGDIVLALVVVLIIGMMIIPLPTFVLDILLTLNITIAVTLLLVSMYIPDATKLASFPTILLITTLFRLALNVSSTRLVLLYAYAGEVIQSFGKFVVAGNYVVGAVIFLILTLIQFIVIAKGAERVAEVAARFTLDAMPGKQMSIDADLRAGAFDLTEARRRRLAIQRESQLYGSMDGAMKFVKGDAIAGIIITGINIVGGLIIGVLQKGMPLAEAAQTYSLLTIGDGLVSQIPALLISVTAGMVTTRVASEDENSNLAMDIGGQLLAQPKAFAISSGILVALGIVPGLPTVPFFILAALVGGMAYGLFKTRNATAKPELKKLAGKAGEAGAKDAPALPGQQKKKPDALFSLTIPLSMELSKEITEQIRSKEGEEERMVNEVMPALRQAMYLEVGIRYPGIQIRVDLPLPPHSFMIRLKEVPVSIAAVKPGFFMVNEAKANLGIFNIPGEETKNPATGKPACWVAEENRQKVIGAGLRVWDTPEILMLHLSGFMKKYAAEFLDLQEVQILLDLLSQSFPTLVQEVVPKVVSLHTLTDILQRLVQESISIKDLRSILQGLSEWGRVEKDPVMLCEYVRSSLKRYISYKYAEGKNMLVVYLLDPEIEDTISSAIQRTTTGNYLALDPDTTQDVLHTFRQEFGNLPPTAQRPVIVTDMEIRRYVRRLVEMDFENLAVLSYQELSPELHIQPIARISLKKRK
jgi:type III secretion protein V